MFNYIDENVKKIVQNPDNVLYLRKYDVGKKQALFALIREDQGVYKKVQLTQPMMKMNFPYEPIRWFRNGPGYYFLDNFICANSELALNINNLEGFRAEKQDSILFNIGIFAVFNDGSETFITCERKKNFEKRGIEKYMNLLKRYKEPNLTHEKYYFIERYESDNDTFIIPELQNKAKDEQKVKKLTRDNK